jgi:hypothetical protein
MISMWLGSFSTRQQYAMAFLSLQPIMELPRLQRIHPLQQRGNMWLDEYDDMYEEEDDFYYTELPQMSMEDRPAAEISASIVSQQAKMMRDSSLDANYYDRKDNDHYEIEDDAEDAPSTEPGNFWINPVPSPLTTTPERPDELRRRRRATTLSPPIRKSSIRSGAGPKPPPPLMDFYNRLFWYGLDPSDDVSGEYENEADSEKRTMFGGTKGKFNGLSFLSDAVGVVPPEQQRPYRRRRNGRRSEGEEVFDTENDKGFDPEDDSTGYPKDATQRRRVPVTPPYDPPQVPTMNVASVEEHGPRRKPTGRQRHGDIYSEDGDASIVNSGDDSMEGSYYDSDSRNTPDDARARSGRDSASRRGRSSIRRGDWVTTTVSSWFDDDPEEEDDGNRPNMVQSRRPTSSSPRRRSRAKDTEENDSDGSFQYPPALQTFTGALETFLGMDREMQQRQAAEYDERMGFRNKRSRKTRPNTAPTPSESVFERRRASDGSNEYRTRRTTVAEPNITPENVRNVLDAQAIPDKPAVKDEAGEWAQTASQMKPLTWEERALAIERVPPAGMAAWGPEGEIPNMDARSKALQDAIVDIKLVQDKIKEYERSILDLQDEMSILKIDIELERREFHNQHPERSGHRERRSRSTSNQRLLERIRSMELEFENRGRKLRYLQQRKGRAEQELADLNRRHWALFHCMKQIVANDSLSKQMEDIMDEFNEAEPAAARLYVKTRERAVVATAYPAVVPADNDPSVSAPFSVPSESPSDD